MLRELEWRAVHEPRRAGGQIAVPPYRFDYVDAMSTWPQWDDIFIHQSLEFDSDAPAPRILDCGANIGLASIYFRRRYPRAKLTAFEADPRLASICRRNLAVHASADGWRVIAGRAWPDCETQVESHGNCLAAAAAMYGVAAEELSAEELDATDPRYPVLVTIECRTR